MRATRGPGCSPPDSSTWDQFVRAHAQTMWACDFISRKVWTARGLVEHFMLFFIHVGSRRVIVSPATRKPDAPWMPEQARRFAAEVSASIVAAVPPLLAPLATPEAGAVPVAAPRLPGAPSGARPTDETGIPILLRDNDRTFTREFAGTLRRAGIRPHPLPIQSPNLNAFAERWVQTVERECLDRFVVFGRSHLDHLVGEFVDYDHHHRPHQGLGGRLIDGTESTHRGTLDARTSVARRTRLGGALAWYERRAA